MLIQTKYDIGQRIWIMYKHQGEVQAYCEPILEIVFEKDRYFYATEHSYDEIAEKDIILEDDKDKLFEKIQKLMKEIDEEEAKENGE